MTVDSTASARLATHLEHCHPEIYKQPAIHFHVWLDSLGGFEEDGAGDDNYETPAGWTMFEPTSGTRIVRPIQRTGLAYMADTIYDLTGYKSLFTVWAQSSLTITKTAAPGRHCDYSFTGGSDHFWWSEEDGLDRITTLAQTHDLIAQCPAFDVKHRGIILAGGATDAIALHNTTIDAQDIIDAFVAKMDFWEENYGCTFMALCESGEVGIDATAADNDQATNRDMTGLRAAQRATAAADSRIFMAMQHRDDVVRGTPFNTFTVDGDGALDQGQETHDGAHYATAYLAAIGIQMGLRTITFLNLPTL